MAAKEIIIVGGGLVGAAIAYGAAQNGASVTLLDQGDIAHRASRGNFGLLWVQGKGSKFPAYAAWTRDAVSLWPNFSQELKDLTGVDPDVQQQGGYWIGFSEKEVEARQATLAKINAAVGGIDFQMLDRSELKRRLPAIGPAVAGGSFCPIDGHANPLKMLHALHAGLNALGARIVSKVDITSVKALSNGDFQALSADGRSWKADRIVIAAGLGTQELAAQLGMTAPVLPKRGQVLITERLQPFLPLPTNKVRQTHEGSVQLGSSTEEVGMDDGTTVASVAQIAKRSIETFPVLGSIKLVRAWGALRVMTPDGLPIYEESATHPGAFVATSHSGVTLAAAHAQQLAPWILGISPAPAALADFSGSRFKPTARSVHHA